MNFASPNNKRAHDDFGIDIRAVSNYERVFTADFTPEATVDSDAPFEMELSFKVGSASKQSRQLGGGYRGVHGD